MKTLILPLVAVSLSVLSASALAQLSGGSTGGGAVALACGMVPLADGSDFGGSLRNPPSFCNVVGLRPSPGRVPNVPTQLGWFPFSVPGPVARNVADCAQRCCGSGANGS